jgi:uncharacterized protein (TIGR02271 family)
MRIPISSASDWELVDGSQDIRGWPVETAVGEPVGRVVDLLIDTDIEQIDELILESGARVFPEDVVLGSRVVTLLPSARLRPGTTVAGGIGVSRVADRTAAPSEPEAEPAAASEPEPEAWRDPEPEPEPDPGAWREQEPEQEPEPLSEAWREPEPDPAADAATRAWLRPEPETGAEPETGSDGWSEPETEAPEVPEPEAALQPPSEPDVEPEPDQDHAAHSDGAPPPEVADPAAATMAPGLAMASGHDVSLAYPVTEPTVRDEESVRVPVMREELRTGVVRRDAGAVEIEKRIVEEEHNVDIPVIRDRVQVRRIVVDRPADGTEHPYWQGDEYRIPVVAERIEIRRVLRVVEELILTREQIHDVEHIRETVRREAVTVREQRDRDRGDRPPGSGPTSPPTRTPG